MTNQIPAKLIIGDDEKTIALAELTLQKEFCKTKETHTDDAQQKSCFCLECRRIKSRQSPYIIWLSPEKDYKVDDVEIIFEKVSLALDEGQKFYFVLERAHTLTGTVANRLLKVLEEPPRGYNFLLLAQNQHMILPTIISRCFIVHLSTPELSKSVHPVLSFFVSASRLNNATEFEQELKRQELTDSQSQELAHQLLNIFMQTVVDAYKNCGDKEWILKQVQDDNTIFQNNNTAHQDNNTAHQNNNTAHQVSKAIAYDMQVIEYLRKALTHPPQSGSSEMFWKNLFLNWPRTN